MRLTHVRRPPQGGIGGGLLLLLGLLAFAAAWLIPAPFRAWAPDVLSEKGSSGELPEESVAWLLDQGATGAAVGLLEFLPLAREAAEMAQAQAGLKERLRDVEGVDDTARARLLDLETAFPALRVAGMSDPYVEGFLDLIEIRAQPDGTAPTVAETLASSSARARLEAFLESSSNATVKQLLALREVAGWQRLSPVFSAAGAPLDTAILSTALLVQGGHWDPRVMRWLRTEAESAAAGEGQALARLEVFFLAGLSFSQSLGWGQWAAVAATVESWEEWGQLGALWREYPERVDALFSLAVFSAAPSRLVTYLEEHGDRGWAAAAAAWFWGRDALLPVLDSTYPLHGDPLGVFARGWVPEGVRPVLARWTALYTPLFIGLRLALFFFAGFCAMAGLAGLVRSRSEPRGPTWVGVVRDAACGGLVLLLVLVVTEPELMSQPVREPGKLFLEFEIAPREATMDSETMPDIIVDQITILVLLIFFVIQLVLYGICLIKLSQVKRAPLPSSLKIRLLENEDNLFDAGLYVGLGGTVVALLALAMGVVQASLVAAYASTLFGIVFVAVIKIIHVRPLRKRLILDSERH